MSERCGAVVIPEADRLNATPAAFGNDVAFPFRIEPTIYNLASQLSDDYTGGFWVFYALPDGGFFMAPDPERQFRVKNPLNYADETVSGLAFGAAVCCIAYSQLSFWYHEKGNQGMAERMALHHQAVLDWCYSDDNPEAGQLCRILD
jgi:hypothetical protein